MKACDNPFRTERLEQIGYRCRGTTWPELIERCALLHYRAAVIGPIGSGKTTFLDELAPHLHRAGFSTRLIRLDAEHNSFAPRFLDYLRRTLTSREIILFDGAEKLNPLAWWRFRRRTKSAGGLIITTHRAGRLPTLWKCQTSPELLAEIASELLGRRQNEVLPRAESLLQKHRGNARAALREWYDLVAAESDGVQPSG